MIEPGMNSRQRAFSLIEIMIVVAVIGALGAIAVPSYQSYVERSRVAKAVMEISMIAGVLKPYWEDNIRRMRDFAEQRPEHCFNHAIRAFPQTTTGTADVTLAVDPPQAGSIEFSTLHFKPADLPWTGTYFRDIPIPVKAVPNPGWRFKGWSPGEYNGEASATFVLHKQVTLTALFEPGSMLSDTQDLAREKVLLQPNPATDKVLVRAVAPILSANLHNAMGQAIQSWDFKAAPVSEQWLSLNEMAAGTYVLSVKLAEGGVFWRRLVVL